MRTCERINSLRALVLFFRDQPRQRRAVFKMYPTAAGMRKKVDNRTKIMIMVTVVRDVTSLRLFGYTIDQVSRSMAAQSIFISRFFLFFLLFLTRDAG